MLRRYNNAEPNVLNDVDDFIQSKNDEDREHFMVLRREYLVNSADFVGREMQNGGVWTVDSPGLSVLRCGRH